MDCNDIKEKLIEKEEKTKKKITQPQNEPATSASMDKGWCMRSAGTWHLTLVLSGKKTVHTFRNFVDCNEIKGRFIKRRKKEKKIFTHLEFEPATSVEYR